MQHGLPLQNIGERLFKRFETCARDACLVLPSVIVRSKSAVRHQPDNTVAFSSCGCPRIGVALQHARCAKHYSCTLESSVQVYTGPVLLFESSWYLNGAECSLCIIYHHSCQVCCGYRASIAVSVRGGTSAQVRTLTCSMDKPAW